MTDDILKFRAQELKDRVLEAAAERDVTVSEWLREASTEKLSGKPAMVVTNVFNSSPEPCSECGDECSVCGGETLTLDEYAEPETATIMAFGGFDETTNPEVLALIERARELMAVGAVGVSVALDIDPADMPDPNKETDPEEIWDAMDAAHQRVRHVAIVDTPAFSGAFLDIAQDGTLTGPVVFEGIPTGDGRGIPFENITLDESILPIPILFDLEEGDHTGVVVGHIERLERVKGIEGAGVAPIAASINVDAYPAYLFAEPEPTAMTVHAPDKDGYRRYSGILAPAGVCHKGMGGCYTYKAASLDYFHSGARVMLDNGQYTRVGPLMFGDLHADDQNFDYAQALKRANEDARVVFAMGKTFHHPKGLLFSGVLMPDADIPRIQATAPSVEQWPDHRGRLELKTALMVPRPAYPVAASLAGGGIQLAEASEVIVEEEHGEHHTRLEDLAERVTALEESTAELLAAHLNTMLADHE